MKKILIGTHNKGKFKEISYLLSKKIKKVSPIKLKIKSPKETGKTFSMNAKLKAKYFSRFTKLPVISDDSGLCIKALGKKPGIYSARWAKKHGSFSNAMKFILKKFTSPPRPTEPIHLSILTGSLFIPGIYQALVRPSSIEVLKS